MKTLLLLALSLSAQALSLGNSLDSCEGRCGYGTDSSSSCQCNPACQRFGDCCADYQSVCTGGSEGRPSVCVWWGERGVPPSLCGANWNLRLFHTCLPVPSSLPGASSALPITDAELLSVAELLFALDENKASPALLVISPQALVSSSQTNTQQDLSPGPLSLSAYLSPSPAACLTPSLCLTPSQPVSLALCSSHSQPVSLFLCLSPSPAACSGITLSVRLSAVLNPRPSVRLPVCGAEPPLALSVCLSAVLNPRPSVRPPVCGAEPWPVCLSEGEIKKGKVSGFHNWVQFYLLEKEGLLNYYSHNFDGPWTGYPDVLGMQFNWDGYFKQVGSALIGSSPEFDLALYTLCYIARPGKQ
uniref:Uridylate-specific endoribonuclease n=1 Tax=Lepisosteus oculatus TaxID=7918 RepID=W5MK49_LEPOC